MFRSTVKNLIENRYIAWLCTFLIFVACVWPGSKMPEGPIIGFDKLVHVIMFLSFTTLWLSIYPKKPFVIIIIGFLYGFGLEICQQLMPFDRTFDWWDVLADTVGLLVGYFVKTQILDRYLQRLY
jgi:VanZ family protein